MTGGVVAWQSPGPPGWVPTGEPGISTPHTGEARPLRGVASVRHSREPFSGDLPGVLRETPVLAGRM